MHEVALAAQCHNEIDVAEPVRPTQRVANARLQSRQFGSSRLAKSCETSRELSSVERTSLLWMVQIVSAKRSRHDSRGDSSETLVVVA